MFVIRKLSSITTQNRKLINPVYIACSSPVPRTGPFSPIPPLPDPPSYVPQQTTIDSWHVTLSRCFMFPISLKITNHSPVPTSGHPKYQGQQIE